MNINLNCKTKSKTKTEQVIPLAYCTPLPKSMGDVCKESLTRLPHAWLLPNLFHLIWTRLRTEPKGETSNRPQWSLRVCILILWAVMVTFEFLLICNKTDAELFRRRLLPMWRAEKSSATSCPMKSCFSTVSHSSTDSAKSSSPQTSDSNYVPNILHSYQ